MCKFDKIAVCQRCKHSCKPVQDCYDHEFGRTTFLESDCCGAPITWESAERKTRGNSNEQQQTGND